MTRKYNAYASSCKQIYVNDGVLNIDAQVYASGDSLTEFQGSVIIAANLGKLGIEGKVIEGSSPLLGIRDRNDY